jgi:hypothetical protein
MGYAISVSYIKYVEQGCVLAEVVKELPAFVEGSRQFITVCRQDLWHARLLWWGVVQLHAHVGNHPLSAVRHCLYNTCFTIILSETNVKKCRINLKRRELVPLVVPINELYQLKVLFKSGINGEMPACVSVVSYQSPWRTQGAVNW